MDINQEKNLPPIEKNFEYYFFNVISYLFNPLLMPSYGLLVLINKNEFLYTATQKQFLLTYVFSGTFLIPVLILPVLKHFKLISAIDIPIRKQRILPFVISLSLYFFVFLSLRKVGVNPEIPAFLAAGIGSMLVSLIITFFWKISIHTIGTGGITGLILYLLHFSNAQFNIYFVSVVFIIAAFVASARLYLKAHDILQVTCGFLLGLTLTPLIIRVYLQYF